MINKILLVTIAIVTFSVTSLVSQEWNNGFSTGGMVILETNNSGGAAEIGFSVYSSDKMTIRNHILLSGFGYDGGGIITIGDKLMIGGFGAGGTRPYSFIEANGGIYKTESKDFLETPLY